MFKEQRCQLRGGHYLGYWGNMVSFLLSTCSCICARLCFLRTALSQWLRAGIPREVCYWQSPQPPWTAGNLGHLHQTSSCTFLPSGCPPSLPWFECFVPSLIYVETLIFGKWLSQVMKIELLWMGSGALMKRLDRGSLSCGPSIFCSVRTQCSSLPNDAAWRHLRNRHEPSTDNWTYWYFDVELHSLQNSGKIKSSLYIS